MFPTGFLFIFAYMSDIKHNVSLVISKTGTSKLNLVKAIKIFSGMGLKESKEVVDKVSMGFEQVIKARPTKSEISAAKGLLSECEGCVWRLNDLEQIRNRKLIDLGMGTREDLVEYLVEKDLFEILESDKSYDTIYQILKSRYDHLSENTLNKILNICE